MVGGAEPKLVFSNRCAIAGEGSGTILGVVAPSVADTNFVQSETVGVLVEVKNASKGSDVYLAHGEQAYHKAQSSVLAIDGVQLAHTVTGNRNGCAPAKSDSMSRRGGALKPSFQTHVRELVRNHNPAILVLMETRVGGERAREISGRLPYDNAIHTNTIEYAGGLWMLWNSNRVDVTLLASTEQEIHTIIKRAVSIKPSSFLLNLEKDLLKEFDMILRQEEELWAMKSQVSWMIQGERNTAFYHASTLIRRKRNQILAIKNAMGEWIYEEAFKAPGPDGLHAGFYQRFCLIVGRSVTDEVQKFFTGGRMPYYLNRTLIALIPKIQGPEILGNYRPISLCNSIYKLVTKIIVTRLRPYFEKLISPLQAAFVPRRKGIDNAIIAQEVIHTISRMRGKVGYIAVKIDLEKAYDKLKWNFIRVMLFRANLPKDLIDIIMSCVSSVSTSIMVNGEALEPIYPSRGIRQGDPLSSYLFILCMDFLRQLIEEKCKYANCAAIREVLDVFCGVSGQTINEAKSRVYFSPNVDDATKEDLCDVLGFVSTPNLGNYLGIPIKHPKSTSQDYNFVLDSVKQKLAGWKANLLSMASPNVLIQASLATIPAYVMQCAHLPRKILDGLDRVNRNFLWGSLEAARKIHWVGWHKVTKPKDRGGLGLQTARGRNTALLAKLNWRLHNEKDTL
ncbi:hypothetical protein SO802_034095 [Lithocarpus litseifolius]|uniref:Reverse transcriptase domain-containing protein n=1 Tax=Lithocarpus litseifolius TaxID=425828 RepID=A0AAW2BKN7_9ROSI